MAFTFEKNPKIIPQQNIKYEKITVDVNGFVYKDTETGFFVLSVRLPKDTLNLTAKIAGKETPIGRTFNLVGTSLYVTDVIKEGQELECFGNFEIDSKYKKIQFKTEKINEIIPTKPAAIQAFLSNGRIRGIGEKIAKKIVDMFGAKTIEILDNNPEKLLGVDGITENKLVDIKASWKKYREIYEIKSTMDYYGIGDNIGLRILNHFKEKALYIIKNEPYKLTEVPMIAFETADKIAKATGISETDPERIKKGVLYAFEKISNSGHTAYTFEGIINESKDLLKVGQDLIQEQIDKLLEVGDIVTLPITVQVKKDKFKPQFTLEEKDGLASKKIYSIEKKIAKEIKRLVDFPNIILSGKNYTELDNFLSANPDKLDNSQLEAAKNVLTSKFSILTGGPGTGKTHTLKSILKFNLLMKQKVVLCAPTACAAKRMEDSTGYKSSTVHRLLKFKEGNFQFNEANKLEGDTFVADESSMLGVWLSNSYLRALPDHASSLLLGDFNQLPSVEAGNVLKDMIDSKFVTVSILREIHRQAQNSNIIKAAHNVINYKKPELFDYNSDSDFRFVQCSENEDILEAIKGITKELLLKGVSPNDIQVLTPQKDTLVGTDNLNKELRKILNKNYDHYSELILDDNSVCRFAVGDRLIQRKNNYDIELFNGDMMVVKEIDSSGLLIVESDGKILPLEGAEIKDLNYAYSITIHKSQGSDYPYVIIPMSKSHTFMWDANLLYTAITRGKNNVILVGDEKVIGHAVAHFKQNHRITTLKNEIINSFEKQHKFNF